MQYQVPQFIDIEDRIFGPLTLKQFLYLAGAGALSFILFFAFEITVWAIFTVILASIASALAFITYNGRSMIQTVVAVARYLWQPKFYLWRYVAPGQQLPEIHELPREQTTTGGPLKALLLKFNTARGAISR
jgi:hypothetical protein